MSCGVFVIVSYGVSGKYLNLKRLHLIAKHEPSGVLGQLGFCSAASAHSCAFSDALQHAFPFFLTCSRQLAGQNDAKACTLLHSCQS